MIKEAGNVIIENFGGEISNIVKNANQSALNLVQILVNNFTSFKDQGIFLEKTGILMSEIIASSPIKFFEIFNQHIFC
jgi:hypothetical protein